jgi:hypothetical protein
MLTAAVLFTTAAVSLPESGSPVLPTFCETLSETDIQAYETIRTAVMNCEKSVTIDMPLTTEFWQIFVELTDNQDPLCFNLKSVRPTRYGNSFTLDFTYNYNKSSYDKAISAADTAADKIISGFSRGMSDTEKVAYIYTSISSMARYNPNSDYADNFYGVFKMGESGQEGFAEAFSYVCNKAGIDCVIRRGTYPGGSVLIINRVTIRRKNYNICVPATGYFMVADEVFESIVDFG